MATEVHEGANGNLKKEEVEPLGELKGKEDLKKPADLCNAGDVNGCETLAEKEEPLVKLPTPNKQKGIVLDGVEEGANEPQDGNDYSSEEEEGDVEGEEEDAREAEPYEEDDDEEYVDDGEDEEGDDDDDESQPPPKRRK